MLQRQLITDFIITWPAFRLILYIWIAVACVTFFVLLRITAPYGRHSVSTWGITVSNKLGWIIMELPVLLTLVIIACYFNTALKPASLIMIGLFCLHYINRIFIFPFRLRTQGKQMPLVIVMAAIFFNLVNGFSLGWYFTHFASGSVEWLVKPAFITGSILFFAGMYINWRADSILIHLRKPGETHYLIPTKWLFDYISCPNLFGELLEWLGFAILCGNLPALAFLIWTAANLVPRALSHHKWYKERFSDYPLNRKAIIPFVL